MELLALNKILKPTVLTPPVAQSYRFTLRSSLNNVRRGGSLEWH